MHRHRFEKTNISFPPYVSVKQKILDRIFSVKDEFTIRGATLHSQPLLCSFRSTIIPPAIHASQTSVHLTQPSAVHITQTLSTKLTPSFARWKRLTLPFFCLNGSLWNCYYYTATHLFCQELKSKIDKRIIRRAKDENHADSQQQRASNIPNQMLARCFRLLNFFKPR